MKARLLHTDRDVDPKQPLPWNAEALEKDLGLATLFQEMGHGDKFILDAARRAVLSAADNDVETIRYRQDILRDCLDHSVVVRDLYAVAVEGAEYENRHYFGSTLARYPAWVLRRSIELSEEYLGTIKKLRRIVDSHSGAFASQGLSALFSTLREELSDEYITRASDHVEQLKFRNGMLLSSRLGEGNRGVHYVLLRQREQRKRGWLARLFAPRPSVPFFSLDPRDESGARALAELRDRGICAVANALARSADHMRSFFGMLRSELAFYIGCVNLHERLVRKGEPTCFPLPAAAGEHRLSFGGLYDVCLTIGIDRRVVGNRADADGRVLVMVTGANQGGKSTFLRSVGQAQLMMQCGMFVPADAYRSSVCDGLFTHYKREEDVGMKSGKLDEELGRMSDIVDHVTSHSMILFNESFAATNEREGSEIARQILSSLQEARVRVVCVTHLYELAHDLYRRNDGDALFLRAERHADGARTFKLVEGEPLQTSFGEDLYDSVFGVGGDSRGTADEEARLPEPP